MDDLTQTDFFKKDTDIISHQTYNLLTSLYPSHLVNSENLLELVECSSSELLDGFTYYRIMSCTIDNVEDEFAYLNKKMEKLFTALHSIDVTIAYGIISYDCVPNLVIGINRKSNADILNTIIGGLLSGVELVKFTPNFMKHTMHPNHFGIYPAVPTTKIDDKPQKFDIAPMMRSLNGQNYTMLFIAKPMPKNVIAQKLNELLSIRDQCFSVSKRNISRQKNTTITASHSEGKSWGVSIILANGGGNWNDSISAAISDGETISSDIQNGFALELMGYAENGIERLKLGQSCGMWQTTITYSSDSEMARNIIQASLNGEISKPNSKLLPANPFSIEQKNGQALLIPKYLLSCEINENPLCTLLTSEEVGLICTMPVDSAPNFEIKHNKQYPLTAIGIGDNIELGNITDSGRVIENMPFALNEEDLNKHTFICGITGSGKTTTVKKILTSCSKPFMVIESAKKEYRNIKLEKNETPIIYTLGKPEINCLQMNPFYIMAGVSVQTHIDYLKDLFNAAFSFYGPMPYILEKCLQNVYKNKGWNLTLGFHPLLVNKDNPVDFFDINAMKRKYKISSHKYLFPTMYDLKCEIQRYIDEEMQYDGEVAGNIKTAIKTRLESLCNGVKGFMFNTNEYADMEKLLSENVVFELEGLADDSDKAFSVGLLIVLINEYRQVHKEAQGNKKSGLQHLLVVEEAHRLLKNVDTERASENMGNPKGKAVEHFTNMIAEMRSYGQGVIIAEQIPSKLAPDVIKNSSNKIIQRVVSADDQAIIANTIGIPEDEAIYLGTLKTGFALCHKEGMTQPVSVKIHSVEDIFVPDENLYNKDFQQRMNLVNSNIVKDATTDTIERMAFKLINTLLVCDIDRCISSIYFLQEEIENVLCKEGVDLVLCHDTNKILATVISDTVKIYLMSGICRVGKLINDDLSDLIFNMLRTPTLERINEFKENVKQLYARDTRNMGITIVSEMVKFQYEKGIDFDASIRNFFLKCNNQDVADVIDAIKRGGER
ncbi:ATP-binding protein [Neobacillus piezotolerans]|uniref:ATP-binding protein n=1 Tax=Neobacillus piezotolerans TaxID=2259171 RepID=A0A3D8GW37_9BACI|nr:ATP-binding protein [Neobacillus piezotolerans]RDU38673.1 ATP-binding protein [Neobacillus piezotolerans]